MELVRLPVYVYICNLFLFNLSSQALFILQVDSFKCELERFYGKNPLESKDLSRVVNSNHFARLLKLLDEDKVSSKIVYGGERDKSNL